VRRVEEKKSEMRRGPLGASFGTETLSLEFLANSPLSIFLVYHGIMQSDLSMFLSFAILNMFP